MDDGVQNCSHIPVPNGKGVDAAALKLGEQSEAIVHNGHLLPPPKI